MNYLLKFLSCHFILICLILFAGVNTVDNDRVQAILKPVAIVMLGLFSVEAMIFIITL